MDESEPTEGSGILLLTVLPALLYIGLVVYALIDCLQTPPDEVYRFSRGQWLAAIGFIPVFGAFTWLLVSRPNRARHGRARPGPDRPDGYGWTAEGLAQYPIGPDDDPEFMAGLGRAQRERKRLLTRQEEDRRRREDRQRREDERREDEPGDSDSDRA
jgi:hypothetical protein